VGTRAPAEEEQFSPVSGFTTHHRGPGRTRSPRSQKKPFAVAWTPCYRALVIRSFANGGTEDVFNGRNTKAARRACPRGIWPVAARKLEHLDSAERLEDLRVLPGNRLEALVGDRRGRYSIRINQRYRVCFRWAKEGPSEVEIVDYH
jgi:proteic killer suppression protein